MLSFIKKISIHTTLLTIFIGFTGCKKYLEEKSNQKLVIPTTIQDLQGLLDAYTLINQSGPAAAEKSADDYYLTPSDLSGLTGATAETDRRTYKWENDNLFVQGINNDWGNLYKIIFRSNIVLSEIEKIHPVPNNELERNNLRGHAFYLRGSSFLKAAFIWTLAYDKTTSSTELGIPLRLDPNFNIPSVRATLQQTYDQIISDLKEASILLPISPIQQLRPSKPAAYGLLARTYLSMREYDSCLKYADLSLQLKNDLIDYNSNPPVNPNTSVQFSIKRFNAEVIMDCFIPSPTILSNSRAKIDSNLYNSYNVNDMRKVVFFKSNNTTPNTYGFRGSYIEGSALFDGIAVDEVYLMRGECYARKGDITDAMNDLNTLMKKRWKNTVTYPIIMASDATDALNKILTERRKELIMRGLRWMDIKRLNKEGANILLKRFISNQAYTLSPNDLRYALPIPDDVIQLSGIQQNPR